MDHLNVPQLAGDPLPGRIIRRAAGKVGPIVGERTTVAFGTYAAQ